MICCNFCEGFFFGSWVYLHFEKSSTGKGQRHMSFQSWVSTKNTDSRLIGTHERADISSEKVTGLLGLADALRLRFCSLGVVRLVELKMSLSFSDDCSILSMPSSSYLCDRPWRRVCWKIGKLLEMWGKPYASRNLTCWNRHRELCFQRLIQRLLELEGVEVPCKVCFDAHGLEKEETFFGFCGFTVFVWIYLFFCHLYAGHGHCPILCHHRHWLDVPWRKPCNWMDWWALRSSSDLDFDSCKDTETVSSLQEISSPFG